MLTKKITFIKNPLFSGEPELIDFHIRQKKNTNIVWLKKKPNKKNKHVQVRVLP